MACRYRRKALLLTATALLAAAVLWLVLPGRLSPLEQSLVGTWCAIGDPRPLVLDLCPDRSCQLRKLNDDTIGPGRYALAGKWHIKGGVLVCDWGSGWEALSPVRAVPGGPSFGGVQLPALQWRPPRGGQVVEVTAEGVTVRGPDGTLRTRSRYKETDSK